MCSYDVAKEQDSSEISAVAWKYERRQMKAREAAVVLSCLINCAHARDPKFYSAAKEDFRVLR